jgi:hypothetical protein
MSPLRLRGRWKATPVRPPVQVDAYETLLPATVQGIRRYLGSGLIKGIGPMIAERIMDQFAETTLHVIEKQPARLVEVPGLGPKRTAMITAAWEEQQAIKKVMVFLQASRVGRWLGEQRWARAAEFLQRRGARAVFAGRFLAAVHAVLPIVAGTVRMGYRRFLAAAVLGALTWSALYMTIGMLAGASYRAVAERLNEVSGIVAGGLVGAALFAGVVLIRQGMVRVSDTRVDAGVALAVAALVGFGITIAQEPGARPPDVWAYLLAAASAVVLLARRRWPVAVLGATLVVSLAYDLVGYPAGPANAAVLVAVYTTAAAGRLLLALLVGGAFTGVGFAWRALIEGDALGVEAFSAAALLPTLALLGDAAYRRRSTAGQANAAVDSRGAPEA